MGYIANFEKNFFVFFLVVFGHVIGFSFLLHLNDFVASDSLLDLLMVFSGSVESALRPYSWDVRFRGWLFHMACFL